jgi:hypothetical protein
MTIQERVEQALRQHKDEGGGLDAHEILMAMLFLTEMARTVFKHREEILEKTNPTSTIRGFYALQHFRCNKVFEEIADIEVNQRQNNRLEDLLSGRKKHE